ncbi:MAG: OadG family protein [Lachnospiraceae bacterium]|nr:OadG family protein [Lachnospiraceae bacterium]
MQWEQTDFEQAALYYQQTVAQQQGAIPDSQLGMYEDAIKQCQDYADMKKEAGEFKEVHSTTVSDENGTITCTVQAAYTDSNISFVVEFDKDTADRGYVYLAADDNYKIDLVGESDDMLSLGEKMARAGMNTLMGMGIVFLTLIFISFIISNFVHIQKFANRKKETPAAAPAASVASATDENLADDLELVAVISAAIAASETCDSGFVVRSIRRRK